MAGQYRIAARDRQLFRAAVAVCAAVGPLFILGIPPWVVGLAGASVLTSLFLGRQRESLRWSLVPVRLVGITLGLFLIVGLLQQLGLSRWLTDLAGTGDSFGSLLRMAGSGALGSNLVNDLPAYIALEPVAATSPDRLLALLIGTNLGPLITVWASLATLLWRDRCRVRGLEVEAAGFAAAGALGVPLLIVTTVAALALAR